MTQGQRRKKREAERRKSHIRMWRRVVALTAAAVMLVAGIQLSGLEGVLAEEKSGYKIDVSYSGDGTRAELTGSTQEVVPGAVLVSLADEKGTQSDPGGYTRTVTENGTYNYTLKYTTTAEETGEAVEHEEKLEVKVDGITPSQPQEPSEPANAELADTEPAGITGTAEESSDTEETENTEAAPDVLPLSTLEAGLEKLQTLSVRNTADEETRNGINVYQYGTEIDGMLLNQNPVQFHGGQATPEHADHVDIPECTYAEVPREFVEAELVYLDTATENAGVHLRITGLYPNVIAQGGTSRVEWYYTTDTSTAAGTDYGEIGLGYRLPVTKGNEASGESVQAEIRFYYKTPEDPKEITAYNGTSDAALGSVSIRDNLTKLEDWKVRIKGKTLTAAENTVQANPGEQVAFTFTLPGKYTKGTVAIEFYTGGVSDHFIVFNTDKADDSQSPYPDAGWVTGSSETGNAAQVSGTSTYTGNFTMPAGVTGAYIYFAGTEFAATERMYFSAFSDLAVFSNNNAFLGDGRNFFLGSARVWTVSGNADWDSNHKSFPGYTGGGIDASNNGNGFGSYTGGGEPFVSVDRKTNYQGEFIGLNGKTSGTGVRWSDGWVNNGQITKDELEKGSSAGFGDDDLVQVQYNVNSSNKVGVSVGRFVPGGDVEFIFESISYNYPTSEMWSYVPVVLHVDVYPGSEYREFNGGNYVRQSIDLSQVTKEMVTSKGSLEVPLDIGGTVTITPIQVEYRLDSDTKNINIAGSNVSIYQYGNGGHAPVMVWAYRVKVSGVNHSFKLYQEHESGAQKVATIRSAEGIKEGSLNPDESDRTKPQSIINSYIERNVSEESSSARNFYPLSTPATLWGKFTGTEGILIGLALEYGYTRPTFTITPANSGVSVRATNGYPGGYPIGELGRHEYKIVFPSASLGTKYPPQIQINSKPIKIVPEYDMGGGTTQPFEELTLGVDDNAAMVVSELPKPSSIGDGQYFQGYTLQLKREGGTETEQVVNSSGEQITVTYPASVDIPAGNGKTYWRPGDLITFSGLYDEFNSIDEDSSGRAESFFSPQRDTYQLVFTAVWSDSVPTDMARGSYRIHRQTGYEDGRNSSAYEERAFAEEYTGEVTALKGTNVVVAGYEEVVNLTEGTVERPYVFGRKSSVEGQLSEDNPDNVFANLYYLFGVTASIDTSSVEDRLSEASKEAVSDFNTANENVYYTGVKGENNVIDYAAAYTAFAGDTGPGTFTGFAVKPNTATEADKALILPEKTGLDLYMMYGEAAPDSGGANPYGTEYRDLWEAVFTAAEADGNLTLIPVYNESKITYSQDGGMYPGSPGEISPAAQKVYMGADGKYTLTAEFYMEGSADALGTANYAVYAKEPKTNFWGAVEIGRVNLAAKTSEERINDNISRLFYTRFKMADDPEIGTETVTGGAETMTKITLTFRGITQAKEENPQFAIGPTPMQYRFYMWNAANGTKGITQTDADRSYSSDAEMDTAFDKSLYADNAKTLYVIPRAFSEGSKETSNKTVNKMYYEGESLTVSGTFDLDTDKFVTRDELLGSTAGGTAGAVDYAGEIRAALYRQAAGGGDYELMAAADARRRKRRSTAGAPRRRQATTRSWGNG